MTAPIRGRWHYARRMADTISAMLPQDYRPRRTGDLDRLPTKYGPDNPR